MGRHTAPTPRRRTPAPVDYERPAGRHRATAETIPEALTAPMDVVETNGDFTVPTRARQVRQAAGWAAGALAATVAAGMAVAPHVGDPEQTAVMDALDNAGISTSEIDTDRITDRLSEQAASRASAEAARAKAQRVQDIHDKIAREKAAAEKAAKEAAAKEAEEARQAAQEAADAAAATSEAEAPTETPPAASGGVIVPGAVITSTFGERWGTFHYGVDLAAPIGTPIYSPVAGTVIEAGPASGFGLWVCVQVASGDVFVVGHMFEMNVSVGQTVQAGDLLAWVGNNGQSTGPHAHVEWHLGGLNGTKVDPAPVLGL